VLTRKIDFFWLLSRDFDGLGIEFSWFLGGIVFPSGRGSGSVQQTQDLLGGVGSFVTVREEEESQGESRHVERSHVCSSQNSSDFDVLLLQPLNSF
jgi:hypothetical protein